MPKKEKVKYKTQKAKKVKYQEAKIQLFDYDQVTGTKKENKEKAKQQKKYQKQKLKELKEARKKEKQEEQEFELDLNINNNKAILNQKVKKKKRKIKGIVKFIIFILLISGIIAFLKSPFFTLQKISVKGNNKLTAAEVIKLSKIEINKNMFQKNLISLSKNLKQNPYIKSVSLKIISSSELEFDVVERIEKYYITASNKFYTIDNSGMIIKEVTTEPTNLSMFKTEETNIKVGNKLNESDIKDIEDISSILDNYIYTIKKNIEVSEAYYNEKIGYVINLSQEKKVVYLGDKNKMETKILYLKKIIEQEKGIEGEIFLNKDFKDKFPVFREKV